MIQFEKRSTRETYAGQTSDLSRLTCTAGAMPRNYKTFASAALDPHSTVANPLLQFGKFTQTVIDVAAAVVNLSHAALIILSVVGSVVGFGFLLFCRL